MVEMFRNVCTIKYTVCNTLSLFPPQMLVSLSLSLSLCSRCMRNSCTAPCTKWAWASFTPSPSTVWSSWRSYLGRVRSSPAEEICPSGQSTGTWEASAMAPLLSKAQGWPLSPDRWWQWHPCTLLVFCLNQFIASPSDGRQWWDHIREGHSSGKWKTVTWECCTYTVHVL